MRQHQIEVDYFDGARTDPGTVRTQHPGGQPINGVVTVAGYRDHCPAPLAIEQQARTTKSPYISQGRENRGGEVVNGRITPARFDPEPGHPDPAGLGRRV